LTNVLTPHLFDLSEFNSVAFLIESHRALQQLPVDLSHVFTTAKLQSGVLMDKTSSVRLSLTLRYWVETAEWKLKIFHSFYCLVG